METRRKTEIFHHSACLLGLGSDSLLEVLRSDVLMPEKEPSSLDGWFRILQIDACAHQTDSVRVAAPVWSSWDWIRPVYCMIPITRGAGSWVSWKDRRLPAVLMFLLSGYGKSTKSFHATSLSHEKSTRSLHATSLSHEKALAGVRQPNDSDKAAFIHLQVSKLRYAGNFIGQPGSCF